MTGLLDAEHVAVVDLGYGDAGKGTVVDWLCASQPVHAVIRFNGGAQAGHNVVLPDGRAHTFSQFGAGTLRGVATYLSRFAIFDPLSLTFEADHLRSLGVDRPYGMVTVDRDALVATPYHRLVNQAREVARGDARHGSCGMGVGETASYALDHPDDALRAGDLAAPAIARKKLKALLDWLRALRAELDLPPDDAPPVDECVEVYGMVADRVEFGDEATLAGLLRAGRCVFEGAQGALLDEWRGFHPYTTWSTTTFDNVTALCDDFARLGVLRCMTTRHGAGPLVTEDPGLTDRLIDPHNSTGPWQGAFRVGHFDAVAHRYAIEVAGGIDGLALTHVDIAATEPALRICRSYTLGGMRLDRLEPGPFRDLNHQSELTAALMRAEPVLDGTPPRDWVEAIGDAVGAQVRLTSRGPTSAGKSVRA